MAHDFALCLVGCCMAVAGPVLLVVFWRSFKEDSLAHPIYGEGENASRAVTEKMDTPATEAPEARYGIG